MSVSTSIDPNKHDRFILRQKLRLVINEYEFSLPAPGDGDSPGQTFCFVRQARFKFKEDIRFYTDESRSVELMRIKARQRFDPRARYDVTAADGSKIGEVQKVFGASLLRSTYRLYDSSGKEVATATEQSQIVALFRRLVGFVPYLDNIANWLPIPYHFVFLRNGSELGSHRRHMWKIRDTYTIDLNGDPGSHSGSAPGPGHRGRNGCASGPLAGSARRRVSLTWKQVRARRVARHFLDERVPEKSFHDVVRDVCGIHAQVQSAAEPSCGLG